MSRCSTWRSLRPGAMEVSCTTCGHLAGTAIGAWSDVVEIALPLAVPALWRATIDWAWCFASARGGMTDHVFRSAGLAPWERVGIMKTLDIVTFLSDFGWCGGYVAACEATIARIRPNARVFHVSHEVPVGDVAAGALVLARVAPLYPEAVHLAVVDPGVGTARRPLALSTAREETSWWDPTTVC